jgi:hypothetical protein
MIRLLPIVLLAVGIVFALASLARAESPYAVAAASGVVCLEAEGTEQALPEPERKSFICWKKIKTGLVTLPCPPDPSLNAAPVAIAPPAAGYPRPVGRSHILSEVEPILITPPPRA